MAIERHWNIVSANRALGPLLAGASADLLKPPVNALRLSLHPEGIAASIVNWHVWRGHILARLQRQIEVSGDETLSALRDELAAYPAPPGAQAATQEDNTFNQVAVPLQLRSPLGVLSFFSTTTVFGTPVDVTLSELAIEAFFPAGPHAAAALHKMAGNAAAEDF